MPTTSQPVSDFSSRAFRWILEAFGVEVKSSAKDKNLYYLINKLDPGIIITKSSQENASEGSLMKV